MGRTLAQKVWDQHVVRAGGTGDGEDAAPDLLYIDLHLVHEVTSPQAFDGLRLAGRPVRRPDLTIATEDHNVPTIDILAPIADKTSATQVATLRRNVEEFGVRLFSIGDLNQGIVHMIGPELGLTQPGTTVVCGDSHTSTHGAFGALAFGIGTSEVEHVLATQTLPLRPFKTMAIEVSGELRHGVTAKDVILAVIAQIGTGGAAGYVMEYRGEAVRAMSMEARMTMCNMSIEAGGRAGMVAPDETTFEYLKGRPHAPQGEEWDRAVEAWRELRTDDDAEFDAVVHIDAAALTPFVTWGTNPGQGLPLAEEVPDPDQIADEDAAASARKALAYMDLTPGTKLRDIAVDTVFLGSCTNARIEDLRAAADVIRGNHVADSVRMLVVPGSMQRQGPGRGGGPRRGLHRGRRRVALGRVLDVPGHERRPARAGAALRLDVEPQLRGSAGQGRPDPPGLAARRRRHRSPGHAVLTRGPDAGHADDGLRGHDMEKFSTHTGIGTPLRMSNVDTDQIIPAVYLKRVTRTGFEDGLFASWRADPSFVLNTEPYNRGSVLVAGSDFGTGSSREHAVWALLDYGFRVVISSRFGEIFKGNSSKAGLLAATVEHSDVELLWKKIESRPGMELTVDLQAKTVTAEDLVVRFEVDDYTRWRLIEGLDDIGLTLRHAEDIDAYEKTRPSHKPTTLV